MRVQVYIDAELGAVAAAYGDAGDIIATASAGHSAAGTYIAVDEAAFYQATGELLSAHLWDVAANPEATP